MQEDFSLRKTYVIITVSLLCYAFIHQINIYIPAFGLTIWSAWVFYGYAIFSALWFCLSPCQKACRGALIPEALFFMFPTLLLLLLVFAQYHPVIAILLLLGLVGGTVAFRVQLAREAGAQRVSYRLRARHRLASARLFVVLAAVLLSVPGLLSVFAYSMESPSYTPSEKAWSAASEKTEADESLAPELAFLSVFREENWAQCSAEERLSALMKLHEYEAAALGMPAVEISSTVISPTTLGYYTEEENRICINVERLMSADPEEAIETLLHESYHAFQYYFVGTVDWDAAYAQTAYFDEARRWRENTEAYIPAAADYERYSKQPLEVSARWFALQESWNLDEMIHPTAEE